MVFVHGGGFEFGSGADPSYDGTRLAQNGVVLVTINYRLGHFGFLALPELDQEGPHSSNFGLQDQLFALKWVRENIQAFGGDLANITVLGESAGAHAIGLLMASPLAVGLFDKEILESGAWWDSEHDSISSHSQALKFGSSWAAGRSLADLRAIPAENVVNSTLWDFTTDPGVTAFAPSLDDNVLPISPSAVFRAGKQLPIPLMTGWNKLEGLPIFTPRGLPHNTPEQFQDSFKQFFDTATDLYPSTDQAQTDTSAADLVGDMTISQQTWEIGSLHAAAGHPTYEYYFTYTSPYSPLPAHTAELAFTFGSLTQGMLNAQAPNATDQDHNFSKLMIRYWTKFAKTGDPNGQGLAEWPQYVEDGDSGKVLELGTKTKTMAYDLTRFKFIQGHRDEGRLPAKWRDVDVTKMATSGASRRYM